MAPREKEFAAAVIILDVGATSNNSGFLTNGIKCTSELLQRKLMAESNDRFGLVILGSQKTKNPLNYEHVTIVERNLAVVDWDLLDFVQNHIQGTQKEADWLDAVVVALHFLKENTDGNSKCTSKKIVLISDIGCPSNDSNFQIIAENMKREEVEFTFISPAWQDEDEESEAQAMASNHANGEDEADFRQKKPMTSVQKTSKIMIDALVDSTEGLICDMEDAMATLITRERRTKKPFPWKVTLDIGPDVRIKTVGYIQVRREPPKTWKKCLANPQNPDEEQDELKAETVFVKDNEDQEVIEDPSNVIESYKYGTEPIPVDDDVRQSCKYEGGPKSMQVIGFLKVDKLPRHIMIGDGCMTFQPAQDDEHANVALSALTYGLRDLRMSALVRRVYRSNSTPRIGALIPETDLDDDGNETLNLVYIELPYNEDMRDYEFAPIFTDDIRPSEEQLEAVDSLIDSMMLVSEDGSDDKLQSETVLNPTYQHLYKCLAHRALKPGQILPDVSEHIKRLMKPPAELLEGAKGALENIDNLFKREVIEAKKEKLTGDKVFGESEGNKRKYEEKDETASKRLNAGDLSLNTATVTEVGTTNPVQDFEQLLSDGAPLVSVVQQLENVILKLINASFGAQMYEKIISCLRSYRQECLERDNPSLYNDYIREFKYTLESQGKAELMLEVATNNLGLISKSNHTSSRVEDEEARKFLMPEQMSDTKPDTKEDAKEEDEDESLLDDL